MVFAATSRGTGRHMPLQKLLSVDEVALTKEFVEGFSCTGCTFKIFSRLILVPCVNVTS